jgi:hypothetical protein
MATKRDERVIAGWLFAVTFVTYAWFFGGGGWNQNANFDLTRALVEDRSFQIDRFRANTGDLSFHAGHYYANKAPGLSFVAAIPYGVAYSTERLIGVDHTSWRVVLFNAYLCNLLTCVLLTAMIPPLLFLYARKNFDVKSQVALSAALLLAFATPLMPYATLFMTSAFSAALLFIAFALTRSSDKRLLVIAGVAGGIAAMSNYLCVPALAVLGVRVLWAHRENRLARVVAFSIPALCMLVLLGLYQRTAFGGFFTTPIETMDKVFVSEDALWLGIIKPPSLEAFWGITFSRYRGLFYLAPVLILALAGAVAMIRRHRADFLATAALCSIFFAFNVTFNNWEGGFAIGPRYLAPVIPLMVLMLSLALTPRAKAVAIGLAVVSFLNVFAAAAVDPQPSGTFNDPLGQYVYPLLMTGRFAALPGLHPRWSPDYFYGHTGVGRHTFEEIVPFAKHRPGSPPAEWASFNLGEFFLGRASLLSLLPLLIVIAASAVALYRKARSLDRTV